ncbi:F-box/FBD/LRR-repeat protein At1g13570-like isoform X1 [Apium graveolens]|uniref:F-box/FBD/LRR-repeat protein At1g13570-like isoform X1 n=1 Tax=Apium graveolens TaxID=4045 RepID=UPI003D7C0F99
MQLIGSGSVERPAYIIPIKRQFTVEGRIWEPQVKSVRRLDNDRISNLPIELMHCIFGRLPVHDAAKTSVLSKTWRNVWKMHPVVILDEQFFLKVMFKNKNSLLSPSSNSYFSTLANGTSICHIFTAAVSMILSSHTGPILDFKLYIPKKLGMLHIHRSIKQLMYKGVKTLVLCNSERSALSSPNLFDCSELIQSRLSEPTLHSKCFANLTTVRLVEISISSDMSFGTQIQELYLEKCEGIEHLACQLTTSNNLRTLNISRSETIDCRWIECTKKLECFGLQLPAANSNTNKSVDLISLLSNSPRINTLLLNGFTLEVLGRGLSVLDERTTKMVNLKKLRLYRLGYNTRQISTCLSLIRNLPNLEDLFIGLELEGRKSSNPAGSTVERHLESLDWKDVLLDRLEVVKINGVDGSRAELHLIKLILASSPLLRVISLACSKTVRDPEEKLRIEQELLLLPRKSMASQIVWL